MAAAQFGVKKMKKYIVLLLLTLTFSCTHASTLKEDIEIDISPINIMMKNYINHAKASRIEKAVETFLSVVSPQMPDEKKMEWRKFLFSAAAKIDKAEVESLELVACDKLSSRVYRLYYIIHSNSGAGLYALAIFQRKGDLFLNGLWVKSDSESIYGLLRQSGVFGETI